MDKWLEVAESLEAPQKHDRSQTNNLMNSINATDTFPILGPVNQLEIISTVGHIPTTIHLRFFFTDTALQITNNQM